MTLQIIKVPLRNKKNYTDIKCPRVPQLYLELLENKTKVIPGIINQKYTLPHIPDTGILNDIYLIKEDNLIIGSDSDSESDTRLENSSSEGERESDSESEGEGESGDEDVSERLNRLRSDYDSSDDEFLSKRKKKKRKKFTRDTSNAPSLETLRQAGEIEIKNSIDHVVAPSLSEEDRLRELLFKFHILEKKYKGSTIPKFTMHSDIKQVQRAYDNSVRTLVLDSNVENYKKYLIAAFAVIEALLSWVGFDMNGYTQQQIISMNSYERLLVELGEKSYIPDSNWSVEVRLIGLVLFNTAMFIGSKIILNRSGFNIISDFNNSANIKGPTPKFQKRKMKPPNVNLDDLPNI
jgi:hypothetical protein